MLRTLLCGLLAASLFGTVLPTTELGGERIEKSGGRCGAALGSVTNTYGVVPFLDPQALTTERRFYRAQQVEPQASQSGR